MNESSNWVVSWMNGSTADRDAADIEEQSRVEAHFKEAVQKLQRAGADVKLPFASLNDFRPDPRRDFLDQAVGRQPKLTRVPAIQVFTDIGRSWAERAKPADLALGLSALRYMVMQEPSSSLAEAQIFAQVVDVLLERGCSQRDAVALTEAVRLARDAAGQAAPGTELQSFTLWQLGESAHNLFALTGDTSALVEAASALRQASALTPYRSGEGLSPGRPTPEFPYLTETEDVGRRTGSLRGRYLASLAGCLISCHEFAGLGLYLVEAIAALREALDVTPGDDPRKASYHLSLARSLLLRYTLSGQMEDLDEAEGSAELGRGSDGGACLGRLLEKRYIATGNELHLRRAISVLDMADPREFESVAVLATILTLLYERTHDSSLLDRAIGLHRQAVASAGNGDPSRPARLCSLAKALGLWAERHSDANVLREAIDNYRSALPIHRDPAAVTSDLAQALHKLAQMAANASLEVTEARLLAQNVSRRFPKGHPDRAVMLAPLTTLLASQIPSQHRLGDADLDRAIAMMKEAAAGLPAAEHERPRRVAELGVALAERFTRYGRVEDREGAVAALTESATSMTLPTVTRCLVSRQLAELTTNAGAWGKALWAYRLAVGLLPEVAVRDLRRDDQEFHLSSFARMASDAAAAAVRAGGTPEDSVSLLESGRGILLTQAIDSSEEPSRVPAGAQTTVDEGPIIMVNVSIHGCQALIVVGKSVRCIPLPTLSHEEVTARTEAFTLAVEIAQDPRHDAGHQEAAARFVRQTLGWLWDVIAEPILSALPESPGGPTSTSRIWWMPTGALSFLPLHAAGYHDGSGRSVMDRAVSSYTPTLRMLRRSRAAVGNGTMLPPSPVAVSMPQTEGLASLPGVTREIEQLRQIRPGSVVLEGRDAVRDRVLALLKTSKWVHFACHAISNPREPSSSHLVLGDGPLSVIDIARVRSEGAILAFLSACSTARGGTRLADEAIHIGSAFQLAGYPHVVATLWPIADEAAVSVARTVYTKIGEGPAAAVHMATRRLRDACEGGNPLLWASHIHIGA